MNLEHTDEKMKTTSRSINIPTDGEEVVKLKTDADVKITICGGMGRGGMSAEGAEELELGCAVRSSRWRLAVYLPTLHF